MKKGAMNTMADAMQALNDPAVMAEAMKMMKDPQFAQQMQGMQNDPTMKKYMEAVSPILQLCFESSICSFLKLLLIFCFPFHRCKT
jgi:hypothetical protein